MIEGFCTLEYCVTLEKIKLDLEIGYLANVEDNKDKDGIIDLSDASNHAS